MMNDPTTTPLLGPSPVTSAEVAIMVRVAVLEAGYTALKADVGEVKNDIRSIKNDQRSLLDRVSVAIVAALGTLIWHLATNHWAL